VRKASLGAPSLSWEKIQHAETDRAAHHHRGGRQQAEANRGVRRPGEFSPEGWEEPGQRPEFEEITVVLKGLVRVEHEGGSLDVRAGQAVVASPGEWVRYSSPEPGGAEYVAICLPAFSPATVHRDS
jgi:mannose-6-phosphate isomerase-like protein (cupin superfamily)